MKQLLTITLLAVCSSGVFAQKDIYRGSDQKGGGSFRILPKIISYGNTVSFVLYNYANGSFEIYDDSFEKTKAFDAVKETISTKRVIRRKEQDDWKETTYESTQTVEPISFGVYSLDGASVTCTLSQTLFNDDEKFEYLLPTFTFDEEIWEEDRDGDGEIDYIETSDKYHYTGFKVVSETGETLYTIDSDKLDYREEKQYLSAFILNGKKYLALEWYNENYENYTTIYSLNSSGTGIQKVMTKKGSLHVSPTIADRSQMITIEMEGDSDKSHEVSIVNAAGQTVKKTFIPAGQRSVQINAAELGHGLNVVNVNGNEGGSSKIIIK